jgi:hypothetical protein
VLFLHAEVAPHQWQQQGQRRTAFDVDADFTLRSQRHHRHAMRMREIE